MMRQIIFVALLLFPTSLAAQPSPCVESPSSVLKFDPYKPSHLAIVRNYGATVLAQASLESLMKLDPYVPTEAALLRQLGGAIPVWPYTAYPAYSQQWSRVSSHGAPCERVRETTTAALTSVNDVLAVLERQPSAATVAPNATPSDKRQSVSIEFDGRVWTSAGPAVRFNDVEFVRVGERSGSPIFHRASREADVVYIQTTPGMVAPFRATP